MEPQGSIQNLTRTICGKSVADLWPLSANQQTCRQWHGKNNVEQLVTDVGNISPREQRRSNVVCPLIIFSSPINGRQQRKQHRKKEKKKKKSVTTVIRLNYTLSNTSNDNLLYKFAKRVITCFILNQKMLQRVALIGRDGKMVRKTQVQKSNFRFLGFFLFVVKFITFYILFNILIVIFDL